MPDRSSSPAAPDPVFAPLASPDAGGGETLGARFVSLVAADPSAEAVEHITGGTARVRTRRELLGRAVDLAEGLGPPPVAGEILPIVLRHDEDLVPLFLAGLLTGRRPCVLSWPTPRLDRDRWTRSMSRLLERLGRARVITRGDLVDALGPVAPPEVLIDDIAGLDGPPNAALIADAIADEPVSRARTLMSRAASAAGDDLAFLQFSSGTTGLPKGLALRHDAVLAQIEAYAHAIDLQPSDRVISWLPLYHDMGLVAATLLPVLTGTPVTMIDPIEWVTRPAMLLEHIARTRSTLCWQPNFAYDLLARSLPADTAVPDLSSLRAWISCSEPVRAESLDVFHRRFAAAGVARGSLSACYAMAENTFAVTQTPPDTEPARFTLDRQPLERGGRAVAARDAGSAPDSTRAVTLVSSGRVIPGVDVSIQDENGAVLPDGHVGRIHVASPSQFPGYWPTVDRTGPYDTGDLGFTLDGELVITGRVKDLIIVRGRNIQPHDVEAAANEVPGVRPGRVVALAHRPDDASTESILLLVEPADPLDDDRAAALARDVRDHTLAVADLPDVTVDVVPPRWLIKTSSGKIARGANLERWLDRAAADAASPVRTDGPDGGDDGLAAEIDRWVTDRTGPGDADRPLHARLDSLAIVELFAWLETRTEIVLDDRTRADAITGTAADLAARVGPARGAAGSRDAVTRPRVDIAIGGDGSLAEAAAGDWGASAAAVESLGVAPRRRVFFRRRLDALASDLDRAASGDRPPAWSPDLTWVVEADIVVIDLFAEMLAAPDVRLPAPGEPPAPGDHLTAIRWLPVDGADTPALAIEPARRLDAAELVTILDRISERLRGRLVVLTHGERNLASFPWADWVRGANRALRAAAPNRRWDLVDSGAAMDRLDPEHHRAPWVPLPDAHAEVLRSTVGRALADLVSPLAASTATADRPTSAAIPGLGGRRRAAHSCIAEVRPATVERWARHWKRVGIAGHPASAPGLASALGSRGVEVHESSSPESLAADLRLDALIVTSGRFTQAALAAESRRHGGIPVESLLTQEPPPVETRLWRTAVRELWRNLHATDAPAAIVGSGRIRRLVERIVWDLPAPAIAVDRTGIGEDLPSPDELRGTTTVVLLAERDKTLQAAIIDRLDQARHGAGHDAPATRLVVPAAWGGTLIAPDTGVFAPDPAETFLAPPGRHHIVEGRWTA